MHSYSQIVDIEILNQLYGPMINFRIKGDHSKTGFRKDVLHRKGFNNKFINWVKKVVNGGRIFINLNGEREDGMIIVIILFFGGGGGVSCGIKEENDIYKTSTNSNLTIASIEQEYAILYD
ncbi:hypothetical protein ACJX0J_029006, partial [Zea mays]